jgi:hypothetical protein
VTPRFLPGPGESHPRASNLSKRAILAIGGVCVVTASIVFAGITRSHTPPRSAPADTTSPAEETPAPLARPATPEPAPARVVPAPRPVEVARTSANAEPDPGELPDEPGALATLRDLAASDPPRSLKLAKAAVERFPDSPDAPELEWNVVKALFNMGRLDEAKDEARVMVEAYPGTYFAGDVDHHLLHPPPNPP